MELIEKLFEIRKKQVGANQIYSCELHNEEVDILCEIAKKYEEQKGAKSRIFSTIKAELDKPCFVDESIGIMKALRTIERIEKEIV